MLAAVHYLSRPLPLGLFSRRAARCHTACWSQQGLVTIKRPSILGGQPSLKRIRSDQRHRGQKATASIACFVATAAELSFPLTAAYLAVWTATALASGPKKGWHTSDAIFAPLAALYAVLLVASWNPETLSLILPGSLQEGFSGGLKPQFIPQLSGIQQLFSAPITAASLMLHLAAINLFAARSALLKGGHSLSGRLCVLLCMFLGPVGILIRCLIPADKSLSKQGAVLGAC